MGGLRGVYAGGARGNFERIVSILADSLAVALDGRQASSRAVLVAVSPPTASVFGLCGGPEVALTAIIDAVQTSGHGVDVGGLDPKIICVGGDTQTWCGLSVGADGSFWVSRELVMQR
jgi:hypothetical protein